MKLHKFLLTAVAAAAFAVPTSQLSADIVNFPIANNDGTDLDGATVGGTLTGVPEVVDGPTTTFTVTSITGFLTDDVGSALSTETSATADPVHLTNINGGGALAVNSFGSGGFSSEGSNLAAGEAFSIVFDQDIEFTLLDLQSFDVDTENNGLIISSSAFDDFVITNDTLPLDDDGNPDDGTGNELTFDPGRLFAAAGTEITFTAFSDGPVSQSSSFRIEDFQVNIVESAAIPEPSSLALLGLLAGVAAVRRRR